MLIFLFVVVVAALFVERRSLRIPVNWVTYSLKPSKRSLEQGEEFQLTTTIENGTGKRLSFLQVEEQLPSVLELGGQESLRKESSAVQTAQLRRSIYFIKKNQRVKRTVSATIQKRGVYYFKTATLRFGDFLGVKEKVKKVHQNQSVIVYPRRLLDKRLERVLSDVMGEITVQSFLMEDPLLVRGYRDYTGHEPMRAISFTQSARMDELMVKEFDHTRQETVNIIFDASFMGDFEHYITQRETTFSLVRTLCEEFEARGVAYRLIMNSFYESANHYGANVMESGGTGGTALTSILDALGAASGIMCKSKELLEYTFLNLKQEKEFIFLSHGRNEEVEALLHEMQNRYQVSLHTLYGEDFEELYLQEEGKVKKAC